MITGGILKDKDLWIGPVPMPQNTFVGPGHKHDPIFFPRKKEEYDVEALIEKYSKINNGFGAVIGRFQTPRLHEGHIHLLTTASENHNNRLLVFIGDRSSPATATNPLSFELRKQMILDEFPHAIVIRLMDQPEDWVWTQNVDKLVEENTDGKGVIFYVGRDSFAKHYHGKHPVKDANLDIGIKASDIRDGLKNVQDILDQTTPEIKYAFRAGIIHQMQNLWHRTYHTVDMALVRLNALNGYELVLVQKEGDVGQHIWRLPGGFVDANETFAHAAEREMFEETGLESDSTWAFVTDLMINDWRLRGAKGVDHKTVLMLGICNNKDLPKASDDIVGAMWYPLWGLDAMNNVNIAPIHTPLIEALKAYLKTNKDMLGKMQYIYPPTREL